MTEKMREAARQAFDLLMDNKISAADAVSEASEILAAALSKQEGGSAAGAAPLPSTTGVPVSHEPWTLDELALLDGLLGRMREAVVSLRRYPDAPQQNRDHQERKLAAVFRLVFAMMTGTPAPEQAADDVEGDGSGSEQRERVANTISQDNPSPGCTPDSPLRPYLKERIEDLSTISSPAFALSPPTQEGVEDGEGKMAARAKRVFSNPESATMTDARELARIVLQMGVR